MQFPTALRALNHRDFRLFWIGQSISSVGSWMQSVGLSWLVLELTNSPIRLGLVSALQFAPVLLFSAVAGGPGPLAVRLPFVLLFAATTWLLFVVGRRLWSPWAGFHAALLANVAPALSIRAGYWLGPDGPLMLLGVKRP